MRLSKRRWQCDKLIEGKLVHTVQRQGTPLLYVIEAQGAYRPEASRKMADVYHERNSHAQSSLIRSLISRVPAKCGIPIQIFAISTVRNGWRRDCCTTRSTV
jgi:hypothetical protein